MRAVQFFVDYFYLIPAIVLVAAGVFHAFSMIRKWQRQFGQRQQSDDMPMSFSQVDSTEGFEDDQNLGADDWISTVPLNRSIQNPETMGLPAIGATVDEVYRIASQLSTFRESISIPRDGVYCPICHVANIDIGKLRTPCPRCGRALLQFGWD
jgi:hypothetical protein